MIDYFALLGQPRQPWLDRTELKERYQSLAKASHPDQTATESSDETFADLVEANRVLSDDKLRLQHLLRLEGIDPSGKNAVPARLLDLFSAVGEFLARSDRVERGLNESTNPLARSVLQAEVISCRTELVALIDQTSDIVRQAQAECCSLNRSWREELPKVTELYFLFAFLTKWLAQLEERRFRLEGL